MATEKLIHTATEARENAHAPYSNYKVGAAVETGDGQIFAGCNVESSSYGLTICAERAAICSAVSAGNRKFNAIAVVTKSGATPCGACRQFIWDVCGDVIVIIADTMGNIKEIKMTDLLPDAFDESQLK
tara:strand:- start:205 stop:591 length:387 start_codon:yes stop_codon:yes gene_type:complete